MGERLAHLKADISGELEPLRPNLVPMDFEIGQGESAEVVPLEIGDLCGQLVIASGPPEPFYGYPVWVYHLDDPTGELR